MSMSIEDCVTKCRAAAETFKAASFRVSQRYYGEAYRQLMDRLESEHLRSGGDPEDDSWMDEQDCLMTGDWLDDVMERSRQDPEYLAALEMYQKTVRDVAT